MLRLRDRTTPSDSSSDSSSKEESWSICSIPLEEDEIEDERDRAWKPRKALSRGIGYGLDLRDLEGVREGPEEAGRVSSWMRQFEGKRG